MVIYEHPTNEIVRVCLRLECLFAQLTHRSKVNGYWEHRATVATLVDIVNVLDRPDFKSHLTKRLIQTKELFSQHLYDEKVDQHRLQQILDQLHAAIQQLQNSSGKLNLELENDEFFNSIRLRLSKIGGAQNFDHTGYHFWLHHNNQKQADDIARWINALDFVQQIIELYLMIIRNSSLRRYEVVAEKGYYETIFDSSNEIQLIRVLLTDELNAYPEMSIGKHRMSIHFQTTTAEQSRPTKVKDDVPLVLELCG
jgi:cell division protein ZapD